MYLYSPLLQNWSLFIRCSLVLYPWLPLGKGILPFSREYTQYIQSLADRELRILKDAHSSLIIR